MFRSSEIWTMILTEWSCRSRSRYASGMSFDFMKETFAHFGLAMAVCLRLFYGILLFQKVYFMPSFAHSRQQSKSRMSCTFFGTIRNSDEPWTEGVRSCYNRWRIVTLVGISTCSNLSPIARRGSRRNQTNNWYWKASDFAHLVYQRNSQSAECIQKYCA
jgi:hypothetical protein